MAGLLISALLIAALPARAAELAVNGTLEAGSGLSASGWTQVPSTSFNYAIRASAAENGSPYLSYGQSSLGFNVPINNSYSLLLTQTGSSNGYAFQTITVPAGATGTISFNYRTLVQGTTGGGNQDTVRVDIVTPGTEANDSSILATLLFRGPNTPFSSGTVSTSLAPFAGQTVSFRVFAYGYSYPANIAIDNVSFATNNAPTLAIVKSHSVTFTQGSTASWLLQVNNTGTGPTTGATVTVSDALPSGYTLASFSGTGWSCSGTTTATCTTTAVVAGGGSFNPLTLNVNVPASSPTSVNNTASAFGGGDPVHTSLGTAAVSNTDVTAVVQVPAQIIITGGNPQSAAILTAFASPLSVRVRDAAGANIPNYNVVFSAPASGASAVMPNSTNTITVATDSSGVASVPVTANATAGGPYTVTAQAGTQSTNFSLTNLAGAPAAIAVNAGDNQSTTILTAFATPLSALVTDAGNNPVPGVNVTFTAPPSGASAEFSNLTNTITVMTDASGIATAPASANATAGGPYLVVAQVGSFSVPFSLTNTVGAPASVSINSGDNQSTTILTAFGPLSVTVRDAGLNPIPNTSVTFTAPNSGASGTFPNALTSFSVSTDASGIAFTPFTANSTAGGPYVVTAQAGTASASFNLTNLVGAPAAIAVNGGDNQSTTILTAFATSLSVLVTDAGNNPVPGASVDFTAPGSGASAEFSNLTNTITVVTDASGIATAPASANATAGGPYTVAAQVGAYSVPFALTNTVGAPASIAVNGGDNQSATILTAFATPLSVIVRDVGNNPVPSANVTFTAPAAGASGVFSNSTNTITVATDGSGIASAPISANSTAGGPYSVTTEVGALSTAFSLTNTVGAPASIAINGGNPQSATILTAFASPLSVIVRDAGNNPVPSASVTFTAPGSGASAVFSNSTNTITIATNGSGIASAPVSANATAGGPYNVTAQVGAFSASFSLTNTVGAPATIAVNGGNNQSAVILTPFATPMSVLVRDAGSNPVPGASVSFTAPGSGASGTFPGNVLVATATTNGSGIATAPTFTANGTAGSYSVVAQVGAQTTSFSLTNTQGATATTIASSATNVLMGEPITLTAHVTPSAAPGTVAFNDGVTAICMAAPLSSGTATCQASFSTPGAHSVSAHYNGSANYSPSTSASIAIAVTDQRIKTVAVIGKFLSLRDDMLLTHEPDGQRQIDRLMRISDDGSGSGFAQDGEHSSGIPVTTGFAAGGNANLATGGYADHSSSGGTQSRVLNEMFDRTGLNAWRDEAVPTGFYPQVGSLTGSTDGHGSTNVSFATSLDQVMRFGAKLGVDGAEDKLPGTSASGLDVWLQGTYASFDDDRGGDSSGHFGVVYLGADWVPRPWLLVGGLVQYDDAKQTSNAASFRVEGSGWMAGPYATVRLSRSIFWQGRAAWGTSSNSVSPFLTYTDHFDSARWLMSTSLTGNWASGAWRFRPTASLTYIEDNSDGYLDHFGVLIPAVSTSLGQFKAEPEVRYVYKLANGTLFEPHAATSLIWNFSGSDSGTAFGGTLAGPEELRGKFEAGFGVHFLSGITLDVSGSYDGIGSDDYNATSVNLGARVPIN